MRVEKYLSQRSLAAVIGAWGLFKILAGWLNYTSVSTFYYSDLQLALGAAMILASTAMLLKTKFSEEAGILTASMAGLRSFYGFWTGKGSEQLVFAVIATILAYLIYRTESEHDGIPM